MEFNTKQNHHEFYLVELVRKFVPGKTRSAYHPIWRFNTDEYIGLTQLMKLFYPGLSVSYVKDTAIWETANRYIPMKCTGCCTCSLMQRWPVNVVRSLATVLPLFRHCASNKLSHFMHLSCIFCTGYLVISIKFCIYICVCVYVCACVCLSVSICHDLSFACCCCCYGPTKSFTLFTQQKQALAADAMRT